MSREPRRRRSFQANSFVEKASTWPWPRVFAEHMRGGAKKDKGMLETVLVGSRTELVEKSYEYVRVSSMIIRRTTIS